ncbi:MAG TPA: molybdenum cofactor guanylyltransferase, partial [Pyrinomonadaceae bacterium]
MTTNFSGYVLAGGKSSRMKTDKAFLKLGGETFLRRAAGALAPACHGRVKIVINENQKAKFEKSFPSFDFVFDLFPERGALGGIHAALKNCETECAIILACDLPLVTGEAIEALTKCVVSEDIAAIVPTQPDGRFQPLCA